MCTLLVMQKIWKARVAVIEMASFKLRDINRVNRVTINNKNHFVNFTGATFVLATHVEGSFSSTSLSSDMKIFFIANIL